MYHTIFFKVDDSNGRSEHVGRYITILPFDVHTSTEA